MLLVALLSVSIFDNVSIFSDIPSSALFVALALVYYSLVGARVNIVQVVLPASKWWSFLAGWLLRGGCAIGMGHFEWLFRTQIGAIVRRMVAGARKPKLSPSLHLSY